MFPSPNPHDNRAPIIAGIGELLWDVFPDHQRVGGAPANFACHCGQLGAMAYPVSGVGRDDSGRSLRDRLRQTGIDTRYLHESPDFPTGSVRVSLNDKGTPAYEIVQNVAWDHLPLTSELAELAGTLDAVCFGSLGQRSPESRATIRAFLDRMPDAALRIFDVNLRQPFYSQDLIEDSLSLANILKLSDEELPVLARYFDLSGDPVEQLGQLRERFSLRLIAYTCGRDGSTLISPDEVDFNAGRPIVAVDTVGAGDSFTAALCLGILRDWSLRQTNELANRLASFVCSQVGATPALPATFTSE